MEKLNLTVGGDKKININSKINSEGYFTDKWGNKIYPKNYSGAELDALSEGAGIDSIES